MGEGSIDRLRIFGNVKMRQTSRSPVKESPGAAPPNVICKAGRFARCRQRDLTSIAIRSYRHFETNRSGPGSGYSGARARTVDGNSPNMALYRPAKRPKSQKP